MSDGVTTKPVSSPLAKYHWKPGQSGNPSGKNRFHETAAEIREMARKAAPAAFERLLFLIKNGSTAVQVQAAKAVLGLAGIAVQPSQSVKHTHELLPAPPAVSLRDLIELVRGPQPVLPTAPLGAMAPSAVSPVAPAAPAAPAVDVEFRDVAAPAPSAGSGASGSVPDGKEG